MLCETSLAETHCQSETLANRLSVVPPRGRPHYSLTWVDQERGHLLDHLQTLHVRVQVLEDRRALGNFFL